MEAVGSAAGEGVPAMNIDARLGLTAKEIHEIKTRLRYISGRLVEIEAARDALRAETNILREEQTRLNAKVYRS